MANKQATTQSAQRDVLLSREPVELYKILKFESLVSSGGEAKTVIANGLVWVNGRLETQKRKKIVAGDVIEFQGVRLLATLAVPEAAANKVDAEL